jgi:hypothetical protein
MKSIKSLMWLTIVAWVAACLLASLISSDAYAEWVENGRKFRWGDVAKGTIYGQGLVFAIAIGIVAILTFYTLLDRSDSLRVPITATLTLVFFAFLLFPNWALGRFRNDLIWSFAVVASVYFAAEAAVQTTRVVQGRKERSSPAPPAASSTPAAAVPGDIVDLELREARSTKQFSGPTDGPRRPPD